MRIPSDMPLRGWTADASYANVPQGMSLSMNNMIPYDQYQGRLRLGTRPAFQVAEWMGTGSGTIFGGTDYPIQSLTFCSGYADDGAGTQVKVDRTIVVAGGRVFQILPGGSATAISSGAIFNTTGRVSAVQFKDFVYFCDGGTGGTGATETDHHYYKLSLAKKTPVSGDITAWSDDLNAAQSDTSGPNTVSTQIGSNYHVASMAVKMGARLAMAGVIGAEETWFLCAIDDPEDWNPSAGNGATADAVAGGTNAADGYGTIGEPIEALVPFGQSGLIIAGRTSLTYLTGDPVISDTAMLTMSRSLGIAGRDAWCAGPDQGVFILTEEGLLFLQPNMFAVDKSALVSRNRLDSFFATRRWDKITPVLVHDVARSGVWIWLNNSESPQQSEHLFYSYATDGFFPVTMEHSSFSGAVCGTPTVMNPNGSTSVVFGGDYGIIGTFDDEVVCGSDGLNAPWVTASTWHNGDSARQVDRSEQVNKDAAITHRIESEVSVGPLFVPEPNELLVREVTVESGNDEYLPDSVMLGQTNKPRVELVYGESVQSAVGNDVSHITVAKSMELIVDGGYYDADSETYIVDGGVWSTGNSRWEEANATGNANGTVWGDDQGLDGGGASRVWASSAWQAETLFVAEEDRKYYPVIDNGFYMERIPYPSSGSSKRWVIRHTETGATYNDNPTGGTTSAPIHYVQKQDPPESGNYPLSIHRQTFRGESRPRTDDGILVYGTHPANSEFGTFDDSFTYPDPNGYKQWDGIIDTTTYADFRKDEFITAAGTSDDVNILDMGCLDKGRGNRRRCRVRALVAFVRIRGSKNGDGNEKALATSGHPFVVERITVEADALSPRNDVAAESCFGSGTGDTGSPATDPTTGELFLGACCVNGVCNDNGGRGMSPADCAALGGSWVKNTFCTPVAGQTQLNCTTLGACCYQPGVTEFDKVCEQLPEGACARLPESTWTANTPCSAIDCTLGRCCFCDEQHELYGHCAATLESVCTEAGGTSWTSGQDCEYNDPGEDCCINEAIGPCCLFDLSNGKYTCNNGQTQEQCDSLASDGIMTTWLPQFGCDGCGEPLLCCLNLGNDDWDCIGVYTCEVCATIAKVHPNYDGTLIPPFRCSDQPDPGGCNEVGCDNRCWECVSDECTLGAGVAYKEGDRIYVSPCAGDQPLDGVGTGTWSECQCWGPPQ